MNISAMIINLEKGMCGYLDTYAPDTRIHLHRPEKNSKMSRPYLYIESQAGREPWTPNQTELLSTGWMVHGD